MPCPPLASQQLHILRLSPTSCCCASTQFARRHTTHTLARHRAKLSGRCSGIEHGSTVTDLQVHLFHCETESKTEEAAKRGEEKGGEDKEEEKEEEDGDGQVVQGDAWPRRRGQALRPDWQCGRGAG